MINKSKSGRSPKAGSCSGFQRHPIGIAMSNIDNDGFCKVLLNDYGTINAPIKNTAIQQGQSLYIDKNGYLTTNPY